MGAIKPKHTIKVMHDSKSIAELHLYDDKAELETLFGRIRHIDTLNEHVDNKFKNQIIMGSPESHIKELLTKELNNNNFNLASFKSFLVFNDDHINSTVRLDPTKWKVSVE